MSYSFIKISRLVLIICVAVFIVFLVWFFFIPESQIAPFWQFVPDDVGIYISFVKTENVKNWCKRLWQQEGFRLFCQQTGLSQIISRVIESEEVKHIENLVIYLYTPGNATQTSMGVIAKLKPEIAFYTKVAELFGSKSDESQKEICINQKRFHMLISQNILFMADSQEEIKNMMQRQKFRRNKIPRVIESLREYNPDICLYIKYDKIGGIGIGDIPVFGFYLNYARDFEHGAFAINLEDQINIAGISTPLKDIKKPSFNISSSFIRDAVLMACAIEDFPRLFKDLRSNLKDEKSMAEFDKEIKFISDNILDGRDFYADFLSKIGPQWGYAIVRVDYDSFGMKPKYRLPAIVIFVKIKDQWAKMKFERLVDEYFEELRVSWSKKGETLPFTLHREIVNNRAVTKFKLTEEEARILGEAFELAYTFYGDYLFISTFSVYLVELEKLPLVEFAKEMGQKKAEDYHFSLIFDSELAQKVLIENSGYISQALVNNNYRKRFDMEARKVIGEKYPPEVLEVKKREMAREFGSKEADSRLAKFLYDERLKLIQEKLSKVAETPKYKEELAEQRRLIEDVAKMLNITRQILITSSIEQNFSRIKITID